MKLFIYLFIPWGLNIAKGLLKFNRNPIGKKSCRPSTLLQEKTHLYIQTTLIKKGVRSIVLKSLLSQKQSRIKRTNLQVLQTLDVLSTMWKANKNVPSQISIVVRVLCNLRNILQYCFWEKVEDFSPGSVLSFYKTGMDYDAIKYISN